MNRPTSQLNPRIRGKATSWVLNSLPAKPKAGLHQEEAQAILSQVKLYLIVMTHVTISEESLNKIDVE